MSDLELKVTTTREVTLEEVKDFIWGTGALSWSWWGAVIDNGDGTFDFTHDDGESEEGAFDKRTLVTAEKILEEAGKFLSEGGGGEDAEDAISEGIGYLDAHAADCVLQRAVLGEIVFG